MFELSIISKLNLSIKICFIFLLLFKLLLIITIQIFTTPLMYNYLNYTQVKISIRLKIENVYRHYHLPETYYSRYMYKDELISEKKATILMITIC